MQHSSGSRIGSYEIVRLLATGGMAEVYLARELGTGREVALKVLLDSDSDDHRALFHDEARVGSLLDHPNLTTVREYGSAAGMHYLVMDYVRGIDLRELQRDGRALPYAAAVSIVAAAATGLDHAHRHTLPDGTPLALVHRDVSLSNIMVTFDGDVKVIDFGIARATGGAHHTEPGVVRGKAAYMAPEQCTGDPIDARTDVFALGVVLYELTTGEPCFQGRNRLDCMIAIIRGEYTPPSQLVADFPPELERVIRTALAVNPAHRYPSALHLMDALRSLGFGSSATAIARLVGEVCRSSAPRNAIRAELATRPQLPVHLRDVDEAAATSEWRVFERARAA